MSIRLRLTLLYTAVLAVTLLTFGGVLYYWTAHNLRQEIDRSLDARPRVEERNPFARPLRLNDDRGPTPRGPGPGLGLALERLGDPTVLSQLLDGKGQIVGLFQSPQLSNDPLPPPHRTGRHYEEVSLNHAEFRMLVVPLTSAPDRAVGGFQPPFTLLLARSLSDTETTLGHMRFILLLGSAIALAAAAAAGWLLARGALRPIDRLTTQAQGIGSRQDFKRRVVHHGPDDEVGRLAATFNGMLDSLDAAHERQRRALDAQRRFVADASHELRTPLTTIRGNVELLSLDPDGIASDQQEALADIASESERMSRLVSNLLALARADGGLQIAKRPVALQPVIAEVAQKASRLRNHVKLELTGAIDAIVLGERDYLVQLLFILVDNALKYTPAGGRVTITPTVEDGLALIAVHDTGVGIAPTDQRRIFDRFYRADPSRHGEGTGLGLAIAAWITQELGGRIELVSEPGKGSTFTVVLPAVGVGVGAEAPPTASEPALVAGD